MSPLERRRAATATVLLGIAATALGLGVLEVAFRAKARFSSPSLTAAPVGSLRKGDRVRLGQIVRRSQDPRIIYELVPGLDVEFLGTTLTTNEDGFRGPLVPEARTHEAARIVGIGDSVMFGWGVSEGDTFLARTREALSSSFPGIAWEVINTAVPGYNTVMEVATFEAKGLRFDPDAVVVSFVGNDLGLPNFIEERPDVRTLERSFLFDFVVKRLRGERPAGVRLVGVSPEDRRAWGTADPEKIPPAYRALAGPRAWRDAMDRLAVLTRARGIEVVVLVHPVAPDFVREAARQLAFPLVETEAAVLEWARANGVDDLQRPPLTITDADPHPSALGHSIIAQTLTAHFRESGLALRLAARRR